LSHIKNAVGARAAGLAAIQVILIDCEEDRVLRAVLVGMLREADRQDLSLLRDEIRQLHG
jgi:hypothetical protein